MLTTNCESDGVLRSYYGYEMTTTLVVVELATRNKI